METTKKDNKSSDKTVGNNFINKYWERSWIYIKTVVDVVREPVLILDKDLKVMSANESFYQTFKVDAKATEGKNIYELGNGQWNVPALRKLLEDILPKNSFFKGFEVSHEFPYIGKKVMILNARQIHFKDDADFQPIIILAMEDITEIMNVAERLADHSNHFEARMAKKTKEIESHISSLEKEIKEIKKKK